MQSFVCDLPVQDLVWHLSPVVLIQLLKQSILLTHKYSKYPEHSQAFQFLFPPLDSVAVGPTAWLCSTLESSLLQVLSILLRTACNQLLQLCLEGKGCGVTALWGHLMCTSGVHAQSLVPTTVLVRA